MRTLSRAQYREHQAVIKLMHLSNKQKHQELFSCAPVIVQVLLRPDHEKKQVCRLTVVSGPEPNTKCNIVEFSKHIFTDIG